MIQPGFVVIYIPSNAYVTLQKNNEGVSIVGKWQVDTNNDGSISAYTELAEATDRVNHIRKMGGEACLTTIIE